MFTGLIEETGSVASIGRRADHFDLRIAAKTVLEGAILGDSIAVNGVCLTVTGIDGDGFTVGLAPETLARTNLGALEPGDGVNLERSVTPTTRMGGHFVQGHVDGTATITAFRPDRDALWVTFSVEPALMRYIVTKGFIAIDGTSLTVCETGPDWFNVTVIDYTQGKIVLPSKKTGDRVNIEVDILAKYVERLVADREPSGVTTDFLQTTGFIKEGAN